MLHPQANKAARMNQIANSQINAVTLASAVSVACAAAHTHVAG